jgi:hypothetical protein
LRATSAIAELSAEQRQEVAAWFEANSASLPDAVRGFLSLHLRYLVAEGDLSKAVDAAWRELRRALHITPSSEKRRASGSPLAALPRAGCECTCTDETSDRQAMEEQIARGHELADWHDKLKARHTRRARRLEKKLAKMATNKTEAALAEEPERLEDIELTEEEKAAGRAAGERFANNLRQGTERGADPAMESVNETLMPGGAVQLNQMHVSLPAAVPEELAQAQVVKHLSESRVRYDFSVAVTRIEFDVEKKVVVDEDGGRHVITASTSEYGPRRYGVTWEALATLAVLVGQFALPMNRLSTMFSTEAKRFTTGALSRMLHYVAQRLVWVYLELAAQLANSDILAGDDTSCRVLEVASFGAAQSQTPPWVDYQTPSAAEQSLRRCAEAKKARLRRREEGDRAARRTPEETPSLGVLLGCKLPFESPRKNGEGPKEALHVTVVSGRSVADDPSSLVVFYRSHLGSCGNLFESLLRSRDPKRRSLVLQGDMSSTNLVTDSELTKRFDIRSIGCSAHARRPFAIYEEEDPVHCSFMLHLFLGLALHEQQLDAVGRNQHNVLAVRGGDSRVVWNDILELAKSMAGQWSKATKLGAAARYIIKHFGALTAYLDNPRLEPTNNLRERMLRMEKLIEGSAMFRRSLEGRFVLDIVRTVLQTAVAAGVPVHEYLVSVLRASDEEVKAQPARFTPRAWAAAHLPTPTSAPAAR